MDGATGQPMVGGAVGTGWVAMGAAADIVVLLGTTMEERGMTNKMLAIRTGLSTSCVARIRAGKTRWPRDRTMDLILSVLDMEVGVRMK